MSFTYKDLQSSDLFVVVTEYDSNIHEESRGPIVMEANLNDCSICMAIAKGQRFARYGDHVICKLVPLSENEVDDLIQSIKL